MDSPIRNVNIVKKIPYKQYCCIVFNHNFRISVPTYRSFLSHPEVDLEEKGGSDNASKWKDEREEMLKKIRQLEKLNEGKDLIINSLINSLKEEKQTSKKDNVEQSSSPSTVPNRSHDPGESSKNNNSNHTALEVHPNCEGERR